MFTFFVYAGGEIDHLPGVYRLGGVIGDLERSRSGDPYTFLRFKISLFCDTNAALRGDS